MIFDRNPGNLRRVCACCIRYAPPEIFMQTIMQHAITGGSCKASLLKNQAASTYGSMWRGDGHFMYCQGKLVGRGWRSGRVSSHHLKECECECECDASTTRSTLFARQISSNCRSQQMLPCHRSAKAAHAAKRDGLFTFAKIELNVGGGAAAAGC